MLPIAAAVALGLGYGALAAQQIAENFDLNPIVAIANGVFFVASLVLVALTVLLGGAPKNRRILGAALAGGGYLLAFLLFVFSQQLGMRLALLITATLIVGLIAAALLAATNAPGRTFAWLPLLLIPAALGVVSRSAGFLLAVELVTAVFLALIVIVGARQAASEPARRAQRESLAAQRAAAMNQAQLSQQAAEIQRWEEAYALAHNGERPPAGFAPPVSVTTSAAGTDRTNTLAIFALVLAIIGSIVGLILGYIARSQIRRTGERGAGLALAAIIIGWIEVGVITLVLIYVMVVFARAFG